TRRPMSRRTRAGRRGMGTGRDLLPPRPSCPAHATADRTGFQGKASAGHVSHQAHTERTETGKLFRHDSAIEDVQHVASGVETAIADVSAREGGRKVPI